MGAEEAAAKATEEALVRRMARAAGHGTSSAIGSSFGAAKWMVSKKAIRYTGLGVAGTLAYPTIDRKTREEIAMHRARSRASGNG